MVACLVVFTCCWLYAACKRCDYSNACLQFDELICLKSYPQLQGHESSKQAEQKEASQDEQAQSQQQLQVLTVEEASANYEWMLCCCLLALLLLLRVALQTVAYRGMKVSPMK